MILNKNYNSVEIDITTYKRQQDKRYFWKNTMDEGIIEKYRKNNRNRFICSICLNKKISQEDNLNTECCKRKSKSCPICQQNCGIDEIKSSRTIGCQINYDKHLDQTHSIIKDNDGKNIQTSLPDVTQGLTLLNKVLTELQSKKRLDAKKGKEYKTVILKDASVGIECTARRPKLSISKTIFYSVEENVLMHYKHESAKFTIISSQPEHEKISQFSSDLLKHKSSSVPQMKLEELKNSLKEKTKSKDAIEEVNRMFATVRKHELQESLNDSNRPMIRNGPRVLPVVKTGTDIIANNCGRQPMEHCRYCKINYQMSGGDSLAKHEFCHKQDIFNERCDRLCCHHNHYCCSSSEKRCDNTHCCNISRDNKKIEYVSKAE